MQGKKTTEHYLHKRYVIGAFYSLKSVAWLGIVLVLVSIEGVPQM